MPTPVKKDQNVSLDQIMSERQFSVHKTHSGDEALFKITKAPASWNQDARSADFVMSTQAVDRYGDIVRTAGIDISEFVKNPVVLFAHDNYTFPIGLWSNVQKLNAKRPPRLEGTCTFSPEGTTDEADTAAKLVAAGFMRACSIGFMPNAWEVIRDEDGYYKGVDFKESELLECSVCAVPAHPHALVKSAGGNTRMALEAIELVLDEWARTPDGLIVPRQEYERAYKATKGTDVTVHEVSALEIAEDEPETSTKTTVGELVVKLDASEIEKALEQHSKSMLDRIKEMFGVSVKQTTDDPAVETVDEDISAAAEEATNEDPAVKAAETEADDAERSVQAEADEEEEMKLRARAQGLLSESAA